VAYKDDSGLKFLEKAGVKLQHVPLAPQTKTI